MSSRRTEAHGRVALVGAGPGDPGLITARGIRRLQQADLVLYDALAHPNLLAYCRAEASRVFVGKRAGRQSERQANIHHRMLRAAQAGQRVVRLKGGDPYLFGRGSEEAEFLHKHGVAFEIVPGVPSSLAAPAYAGIPLTHRELSSSVAYVTATESPDKDQSDHDWSKLATATQTLVIFMGLRKLEHLMQLLINHGRPASTPVAVVQSGSLPTQRVVEGTVADIAAKAAAAGLGMPALTVVGNVVQLRQSLRWYDTQPLFGQRVLVTRPSQQAHGFSQKLEEAGAVPIEVPVIRIHPPADPKPLEAAVKQLNRYDAVAFTSANGVTATFSELQRQGGDARRFGASQVCAIGPRTAAALRDHGVAADIVPNEYRGEAAADAIIADLGGDLTGRNILLPRAAVAREVLPERLRSAGATVDIVSAYETLGPEPVDAERLRQLISQRMVDVVTFTSSSTVKHTVLALGDDAPELLAPLRLASIGPITTERAQSLGLRVDITAGEYTTDGLITALKAAYTR